MHSLLAVPTWVIGLIVVWFILGFAAYSSLLFRLLVGCGKTATSLFGSLDAGLAGFIAAWFALLSCEGFKAAERDVSNAEIIVGALHVTFIVLLIAAFLTVRKIGVAEVFGFGRVGIFTVAAQAIVLIIAAFPLMLCVGALTQQLMGSKAQEQELVHYFTEAAKRNDFWPVISTMAFGIFLAPAAEEFIFRGYIYGVAKKYLGLFPSMILTSLLFAAIHVNLSSLPALFVLAVCLTVAYETTGSLLVAMAMHALFNLGEFSMMLAYSQ